MRVGRPLATLIERHEKLSEIALRTQQEAPFLKVACVGETLQSIIESYTLLAAGTSPVSLAVDDPPCVKFGLVGDLKEA
ncbi:hypothetical protein ERJ75_000732200 [Trypanosoma vivax]|nr:hypothetical protein ERJ75_000732200 [Trypanosoma vivax]